MRGRPSGNGPVRSRQRREMLRSRLWPTVLVVLVVLSGLGARAVFFGDFGKYTGDGLYAVLAYCLIVAVKPSVRPPRAAGAALLWCFVIEFLQLTSIPGQLSRRYLLARLILGSTFNAPDLALYVVGVLVPLVLHTWAPWQCQGDE